MTPDDELTAIQKRLRDFAEGHGERFAANLKAIREGMRAARGEPSAIPAELDVRGDTWPVGEARTITVDELLQEAEVGETLTSDYIRASMTPPHDATIADLMTAGASGSWEIRRIPKAPRGTRKRRHLTWTRRIQAFRRWQRVERVEAASWTIESVDTEAMTVTVRLPCAVTIRPWRTG